MSKSQANKKGGSKKGGSLVKLGINNLKVEDIYSNKFSHIYLYSEISNASVQQVKRQLEELSEFYVDELETDEGIIRVYSKPKPIVLHLNSPGGDVNAGIALTMMMNSTPTPVVVIVEGTSASAATFVTVLSLYRYVLPNSVLLIHQYFGGATGKHEGIKFAVKEGDKLMDMFYKIYREHSKLPTHELEKILKHDVYFTAGESLKYGMVDKIIKPHDVYKEYFAQNPEFEIKLEDLPIRESPHLKAINFKNIIYIYKDLEDFERRGPYERSLDLVRIIHQGFLTEGTCLPFFSD